MARYIDADALIENLKSQDYSGAPDTLEDWTPEDMTRAEIAEIEQAQTADVVEVVRCKDCKFYKFKAWDRIWLCERWTWDRYETEEPGLEDFCSFAERRDTEITGKAGEKGEKRI